MSVSSEFVLRPIQTACKGNEPHPNEESQPSKSKKEDEREEECETPKREQTRIIASFPDPPRKRRCVLVISKRTIPPIEVMAVEKEELDRLFLRRDPVGCAMSVKPGSKRKWCSVSDE